MNFIRQFAGNVEDHSKDELAVLQKRLREVEGTLWHLRTILNHLSTPVVGIEPDGAISYVSKGAGMLLGIPAGGILGRKFYISLPLEKKEDLQVLYRKFLDTRTRVSSIFVYQQKQVELTINPIFDHESKAFLGGVIEMMDMTERKKFEQRQVDFVSYISHELRTPIASVKGYLDVIMSEGDYLTDEHKIFVQRAYVSNERQENTVEKLIDLADLEKGQLSMKIEIFDAVKLLQEVIKLWEEAARQKALQLKLIYPHLAVPKVKADPDLTREVVNNIIENAIKFTTTGSVTIAIEYVNNFVTVSVSDTGPGMPAEVQNEIFEKFVRGEHSLTESTQGSGLGLYLAKRFVEQMGGAMVVDSVPNQGTKFTFTLKPFVSAG